MSAAQSNDLSRHLNAMMGKAREKAKAFQAEATRQAIHERFQEFLPIAEQIVAIVREKIEHLQGRLMFDVIPSQVQTDRLDTRSVKQHGLTP